MYDLIPVKNGFLRSEDGLWINLRSILYFTVQKNNNQEGVNVVGILSEKSRSKSYILVCSCENEEEAQNMLDGIFQEEELIRKCTSADLPKFILPNENK